MMVLDMAYTDPVSSDSPVVQFYITQTGDK
jgi:hypothetical protein